MWGGGGVGGGGGEIIAAWHEGSGKSLERRLRNIININEIQFVLMSGMSTVDEIFIARRMQECKDLMEPKPIVELHIT